MKPFRGSLFQFIRYMSVEFKKQRLNDSAKALTYTSLFAVVPLMTVVYAILSVAPLFEDSAAQMQAIIFENFLPSTGGEVVDYLNKFSAQAKNLTAVGVVMLFLTSFLMLKNIEHAFNRIWHVNESRKGLRSFLIYWAVLSLGPIMLGAALGMRTYIVSLNLISSEGEVMSQLETLFTIVPWLLTALAFTLLFVAVPNCKVEIRHALVGGVITAIVFNVIKWLFGLLVQKTSYYLVYGAFAAVPLFLIWIYISWVLILFGAELVKGFAHFSFSHRGEKVSRLWIKLLLLELLWRRYQSGDVVSDEDVLNRFEELKIANMHRTLWQDIKAEFIASSLVVVTQNGDVVLCKDTDNISLWSIVMTEGLDFFVDQDLPSTLEGSRWCEEVHSLLKSVSSHTKSNLQQPMSTIFSPAG